MASAPRKRVKSSAARVDQLKTNDMLRKTVVVVILTETLSLRHSIIESDEDIRSRVANSDSQPPGCANDRHEPTMVPGHMSYVGQPAAEIPNRIAGYCRNSRLTAVFKCLIYGFRKETSVASGTHSVQASRLPTEERSNRHPRESAPLSTSQATASTERYGPTRPFRRWILRREFASPETG